MTDMAMSVDSLSMTLDIVAVPAGRIFLFAPRYVGQVFTLPHVHNYDGENNSHHQNLVVTLHTLSLSPRLFEIQNFFHTHEAINLIQRALQETLESHRIKRSSTTGIPLNDRQTSENGFDTTGPEAMALKRRSFQLLGFDEYWENLSDGLQILRYNQSSAYFPDYDYIDDDITSTHDYASDGVGSNRFATILLYMTDHLQEEDGGQTVFMKVPPSVERDSRVVDSGVSSSLESRSQTLESLRASGESSILPINSWEEEMMFDCRTHFSVKPQKGKAVLFYSQTADGHLDLSSLHGACPVLHGEKWAANLWVWNAARDGYPEAATKKQR